MSKLERSVTDALNQLQKSGDFILDTSSHEIKLVSINPEKEALVAMIHWSTELTATIASEALLK